VRITHGGKNADCFFVLPERTHHREEAEFISNVNLREKLKLSDGGRIKITFKL
jgi:CTP-dependent riboflavin kinase